MTLLECLSALQEPYRDQAIKNTSAERLNVQQPTNKISASLHVAFNWIYSPEKYDYWNDKYNTLIKMNL